MAVTLQQIADAAGVSRGTVDRVVHKRGYVNKEVEQKILQLMKEMGYRTNLAAKMLRETNGGIKIGIILQSMETNVPHEILKGVESAKAEIEKLGGIVIVKALRKIGATQAIMAMEELRKEGCNAIGLMPAQGELLIRTVNQYKNEFNIPIVMINMDLEGSERLCFVGQDTYKSGCTAAGLMGGLLGKAGEVAIISGNDANYALENRVKGFSSVMRSEFPEIKLLDIKYVHEDPWIAYKTVEELLKQHPQLLGLYLTSYGEDGVIKAVKEKKMPGEIRIIAHDYNGQNIEHLKTGYIDFLIGQNAYSQGYEPVMILQKFLLGEIGYDIAENYKLYQYSSIEIDSKYNL